MRNRISAGLIAALAVSAASAHAAPAQVVIIRHAEKPAAGNDLCVPDGVCRAVALAVDFTPEFGTPSAIYAMGANSKDSSHRPVETVTPLADALGLKINSRYTRKQLQNVVDDVEANNNGMVLVCWEHKIIPDLVQTFCQGAAPGVCDSVPAKWSGSVFDQAWILSFGADGKVSSFQIKTENIGPKELSCGSPLSTVLAPGADIPASAPCGGDVDSD